MNSQCESLNIYNGILIGMLLKDKLILDWRICYKVRGVFEK